MDERTFTGIGNDVPPVTLPIEVNDVHRIEKALENSIENIDYIRESLKDNESLPYKQKVSIIQMYNGEQEELKKLLKIVKDKGCPF